MFSVLDQQDVIRIPEGASIDAMGWPWLVPSFMNTSTLVDYNVNDKAKLGWIEGGVCNTVAMCSCLLFNSAWYVAAVF